MKLKTNFKKWDGLHIPFLIQYIRCFQNFWGSTNALLQIPLKMGIKVKKILNPAYSLKLKNIVLFWIEAFEMVKRSMFFQMVIFATLLRRYPTLWKSTLKMATLFRRCLTLFNSVLKNTTLFQQNFNVDVLNVVSTLIWLCATSRPHINLKTTLNRRWNVCWVYYPEKTKYDEFSYWNLQIPTNLKHTLWKLHPSLAICTFIAVKNF